VDDYEKFIYSASKRPVTVCEFNEYCKRFCTLLLEGAIIAEVSRVGVCRKADVTDDYCAKDWSQMALCQDMVDIHPDRGALLEAFARTICADELESGDKTYTRKRQRGCPARWPEPDLNGNYRMDCFMMSRARHAYTMNRHFFLTSSGHMGLGQPLISPGDKVCILSGADMPFILREFEKDSFSLVGPAYVHGIMDGEATRTEGFEERLRILEIW
jgi:hypothetical protein